MIPICWLKPYDFCPIKVWPSDAAYCDLQQLAQASSALAFPRRMMCSCFLGWGGSLAVPQTASASVGEGQDKLCPCCEHTEVIVDTSLVARPLGEVACLDSDSLQVMKLTQGVRVLHAIAHLFRACLCCGRQHSHQETVTLHHCIAEAKAPRVSSTLGGLAFLSAAASRNGPDVSLFRTLSTHSTR